MSEPRIAPAYTARQCPVCDKWIYTADGPFAEGDRTKTVADWEHWASEHETPEYREQTVVGFPFFRWNDKPVEIT